MNDDLLTEHEVKELALPEWLWFSIAKIDEGYESSVHRRTLNEHCVKRNGLWFLLYSVTTTTTQTSFGKIKRTDDVVWREPEPLVQRQGQISVLLFKSVWSQFGQKSTGKKYLPWGLVQRKVILLCGNETKYKTICVNGTDVFEDAIAHVCGMDALFEQRGDTYLK